MATYILLLTLTPDGQQMALRDPQHLLRAERELGVPGVQALGMYAVLGSYDFVTLVEAESNEQVARFSIELGVKAGVHITTLPAVPISRLEEDTQPRSAEASAALTEERRLPPTPPV
jgi:uncharacterized protein with GYD domain